MGLSHGDAEKLMSEGWLFDWSILHSNGYEIYELLIKGSDECQGLIALKHIRDQLYTHVDAVEYAICFGESMPDSRLTEPHLALAELKRVTKSGGKIIIPTYINMSKGSGTIAVKFIEKLGASFKRQFSLESYKQFFADMGYSDIEYEVVNGRMPCVIAVIKN